jgi:putative glutathione S-transferase
MPDKITKWASGDGSFKRQVSSFRDHIEEGGKFAPEKGECDVWHFRACDLSHRLPPIPLCR